MKKCSRVDTDHLADLRCRHAGDGDAPLVPLASTPRRIGVPRFEVAGHGVLPIGAPLEDHWPGKHPQRPLRALGRDLKPHGRVGSRLPATGDSTALDPLDDGGRHENAIAGAILELDGQHLGRPIPILPPRFDFGGSSSADRRGDWDFPQKAGSPNPPTRFGPSFLVSAIWSSKAKPESWWPLWMERPTPTNWGRICSPDPTPRSTWLGSWILSPPQHQTRSRMRFGQS